ncbi:alpha/beta fold hydrolase [Nocardiopsis deserti]|uniref:alpha/beta fold hydrolase n=1 Tax=Nocardiopsis deserti TaxID=2605988 RepID=UPI00123AFDBA|nr:alpha/beta fold hydrolase [Nocardiopsis deserti]
MKRLAKIVGSIFKPIPLTRNQAIGLSERISSATALVGSLEYLYLHRETAKDGFFDWNTVRGLYTAASPLTRRFLDGVGEPRTTYAVHAARALVSAGMLLPGDSRWRGLGNAFLAASGTAVFLRHRYGTDGADEVSVLVQTGNAVARLSRSPRVQDAAIWHVAIQSNLSYVIAGWFKLLGRPWVEGTALQEVLRTRTYGHEGAHRLATAHPRLARPLVYGVLLMECLFPLVYAGKGRLSRVLIISAIAFHGANGYLMGLGRFLTAFTSMHPHVAYTAAPRELPEVADRDDSSVVAMGAVLGGVAVGMLLSTAQRRMAVLEGRPGTRWTRTRFGNTLAYEADEGDGVSPVLVFVNGLASIPEQFGWITQTLRQESGLGTVTYARPGYGASTRAPHARVDLGTASAELAELVRAVVPADRPVVLVGHSLGGDLARRAAPSLGDRLIGLVYVDASHPAELQRSRQQRASGERMHELFATLAWSNRLGAGSLMSRPPWLEGLPTPLRRHAFAQYADARLWTAGGEEWEEVKADYAAFGDDLPPVSAPALVLSAQKTVDYDPEQLLLHRELGLAHQTTGATVEFEVVKNADHDTIMTNGTHGTRVARLIMDFVRDAMATKASGTRQVQNQGEAKA